MTIATKARAAKLLPPYEEWTWDAKCNGKNSKIWFTASLPQSDSADYWPLAESRCAGCPFIKKCAAHGAYYRDTGVIVAGIPLLDSEIRNQEQGRYDMLERIARGEPRGDLLQPSAPTTDRTPTEGLPDKHDPTPVKLDDGYEYVNYAGASAILGLGTRRIDDLIKTGVLPLTKHPKRKSLKGFPTTYFMADEVRRAAEKRKAEKH